MVVKPSLEAAQNYIKILEKFYLSNLRVEPEKTIIFPKTADISGWIWEKGGYISVSPHHRNSLINTKEEEIKTVKDMRSFIGLYKTPHCHTKHDQIRHSTQRHGVGSTVQRQVQMVTRSLAEIQRSKDTCHNKSHSLYPTSVRPTRHQTGWCQQ